MSGGSFDYLYLKPLGSLPAGELEHMLAELNRRGFTDVREELADLTGHTPEQLIRWDRLTEVLRAVEWCCSADIGDEALSEVVETWRSRRPG